jgi:hypothetical protein
MPYTKLGYIVYFIAMGALMLWTCRRPINPGGRWDVPIVRHLAKPVTFLAGLGSLAYAILLIVLW